MATDPPRKFSPPPQQKPDWMSDDAWEEYKDEVRAHEKRIFRQSGGRIVSDRYPITPKQATGILFADVSAGHPYLAPGCWFFHEGQHAVCASADHDDSGRWSIEIHFERRDKPLTERSFSFETREQAKDFVARYFEQPVIECEPSKFPEPDAL